MSRGRAPGKLFVTGEYAVLAGAPAVVAAIDRYAVVDATVLAPGGPTVIESLADGTVRHVDRIAADPLPDGDAGVVAAAWRAVRHHVGPSLPEGGLRVSVEARRFLADTRKLGLGRSAATLVAAVAALLACVGTGDRSVTLGLAVAAHGLLQDGQGSGADVAAAVYGGLVEVVRRGEHVDAVPRRLPEGLALVAAWTGASAWTAPMLRRFADAVGVREPRALGELRALAAEAAEAVAAGDATGLRAVVARSTGALTALGDEVGLAIVTPALARLVAAAERAGAVAKPSGAGGGDCGIALVDSPAQAAAVHAAWRAEGLVPLELAIATEGVTVG